MSFKKQYLKSKPVCKVTFKLEKSLVGDANKVQILGDFNQWNLKAKPMSKLKSGDFSAVIELPVGEDVQCRYLLNDKEWINETSADGFVLNEFGEENFVVSTKA